MRLDLSAEFLLYLLFLEAVLEPLDSIAWPLPQSRVPGSSCPLQSFDWSYLSHLDRCIVIPLATVCSLRRAYRVKLSLYRLCATRVKFHYGLAYFSTGEFCQPTLDSQWHCAPLVDLRFLVYVHQDILFSSGVPVGKER